MIDFALRHGPLLLEGALTTLIATTVSTPLFLLIGLFVAVGRLYGPLWARVVLASYVEFIRGTPLLVQLFWLFFALPFIGLTLAPLPAGIIGLSLHFGAYTSEVFRAGIQSVPRGQLEAAAVLGLKRHQSLRRVVLPQALVLVLPPIGNNVIELLKATSLLSLITVTDIVYYSQRLLNQTARPTEIFLLVGLFYFVIAFPASLLIRRLEVDRRGF